MTLYLDILYPIFGAISFVVAIFDFLFYRIPNILVLAIIALFIIMGAIGLSEPNGWNGLRMALMAGASTFGVGMLFYVFKWMGAGDVKFISVASLWASYASMYVMFLYIVILTGAGIAIICYFVPGYIDAIRMKMIGFLQRILKNSSFFMGYAAQPFIFMESENRRKIRIPYGVAIAIGVISVIYGVLKG